MAFFNLPTRAEVKRVVPKNAFDDFTNTKQKKQFTDYIERITWTHKLSEDTINLNAGDIHEVQVFKIELKKKVGIKELLEIMNRAIPYHLVFWIEYDHEAYLSTASKHRHPSNDNIAIIDWTFSSDWFHKEMNPFSLNLKESLDLVFKDLCVQISGKPDLVQKPMASILEHQQEIFELKKEISRLSKAIKKSKQFNEKVELNLKLKEAERKLNKLE